MTIAVPKRLKRVNGVETKTRKKVGIPKKSTPANVGWQPPDTAKVLQKLGFEV